MVQLNTELVDLRTGSIATLVDVVNNNKGTLYTVQYGDTEYRRYYDFKFEKYFAELSGETYNSEPQDYSNVVFLDFANRTKFIDFDSWLHWANIAQK